MKIPLYEWICLNCTDCDCDSQTKWTYSLVSKCGSNAILTYLKMRDIFFNGNPEPYRTSIKIFTLVFCLTQLYAHFTRSINFRIYENWCFEAYSTFRFEPKPNESETSQHWLTNSSNGLRAEVKKRTEVWWLSRAFP